MRTVFKVIILTLCSSWSINAIPDAIFRWVDEDGKVHFGETIPPKYKDVAEQIENQPINTMAPEPEIKKQNEKAVRKLRQEDAKRERLEAKKEAKKEAADKPKKEAELTREYCRDNYVTVRKRTECFARVQSSRKAGTAD